ncbi:MAG: carboxypeptidase-like regulatory domain-containing protein, partial [Prevotellaceae bacterium]|nr:carboxypeptidase-like regulatory domain-containing protein [Prevotellaceae bacterium]
MKHIKFTFLRLLLLVSFSLSFTLSSFAQDEFGDEDEVVQTGVKKLVATQKDYTTRLIKGTIFDALTGKPLAGAIVKATDIDGYSALTDDEGHYELKIPVFSHS